MTAIFAKLPSSLQIQVFTYLTLPNERILLVGENSVGKTEFIQKCGYTKTEVCHLSNLSHICGCCYTINSRVKIMELSDGLFTNLLKKRFSGINTPTKIVLMASVVDRVSIQKIYNCFILLLVSWNVPIIIILTHIDQPIHLWRTFELRKLKQRLFHYGILGSLYWVSNKTKKGIHHPDLNFIHDYL
jgi:hypothetical protein